MKRPIAFLAKAQPAWRWKPDNYAEAAETWLRSHPCVEWLLTDGIFFVGGALVGLLLGKWLSS